MVKKIETEDQGKSDRDAEKRRSSRREMIGDIAALVGITAATGAAIALPIAGMVKERRRVKEWSDDALQNVKDIDAGRIGVTPEQAEQVIESYLDRIAQKKLEFENSRRPARS